MASQINNPVERKIYKPLTENTSDHGHAEVKGSFIRGARGDEIKCEPGQYRFGNFFGAGCTYKSKDLRREGRGGKSLWDEIYALGFVPKYQRENKPKISHKREHEYEQHREHESNYIPVANGIQSPNKYTRSPTRKPLSPRVSRPISPRVSRPISPRSSNPISPRGIRTTSTKRETRK